MPRQSANCYCVMFRRTRHCATRRPTGSSFTAGPSRSPHNPNHKQHEYDHRDRDAVGVLPSGERRPRWMRRAGHPIPVGMRWPGTGNRVRGRQRPVRRTLVQLCLLGAVVRER
ncbi:hypothetical protein NKG94_19990 [Micromonospora sp. M12]